MGNVHRECIRRHIELVAEITQVLNPLHFVEAVIQERFVKGRKKGRFLHHHVRLGKEVTEAGNERHIGLELVRPVLGKVVLLHERR